MDMLILPFQISAGLTSGCCFYHLWWASVEARSCYIYDSIDFLFTVNY